MKNIKNDSPSEIKNNSEIINKWEKKERYKNFLSKYQKE